MGVTLDLTFYLTVPGRRGPGTRASSVPRSHALELEGATLFCQRRYLNLLLELVPDREPAAVPEVE